MHFSGHHILEAYVLQKKKKHEWLLVYCIRNDN